MLENTKLAYNELVQVLGNSYFNDFEYAQAQKKCEHKVSLKCLLKNQLVVGEVIEVKYEYSIQEVLDIINEFSDYGCEGADYNFQQIDGKIYDVEKQKKYRLVKKEV